MKNEEEILRVCAEIVNLVKPVKIILHGKKINVATEEIKNFSICVITDTENSKQVEKQIYLSIESLLPYNVLVYNKNEWEKLIDDKYSYAYAISRKGTVVFDENEAKS